MDSIKLQCYRCHRDDFESESELHLNQRYCTGAKRAPHLDLGIDEAKKCKISSEAQVFPTDSLHDDGQNPISYLQSKMNAPESDDSWSCGGGGDFEVAQNDFATQTPALPYDTNVSLAEHYRFQIEMMDVLARHRVDLSLHDELIDLIKHYSDNDQLNFSAENLRSREGMVSNLEKVFKTTPMKPTNVNVKLKSGALATVATFDVEAMILSLLNDKTIMKKENLAPGYDFLTGKSLGEPTILNEFHTGTAWKKGVERFCVDDNDTPIGLVIFGDKSHFDLHGTLATTPLIFTLTCFNQEARKSVDFWRPIGFIPNLSYGKTSKTSKKKNGVHR